MLALFLLVSAALAASPVQLPPGEPAAAWAEPFALAGLVVAADGAAPVAVLSAGGSRWTIRVIAPGTPSREVVVAAPTSVQAREDLSWLIASLLKPVGVRADAPSPLAELPRPVVPVPAPRPLPTPAPRLPTASPTRPPEAATPPPSVAATAPRAAEAPTEADAPVIANPAVVVAASPSNDAVSSPAPPVTDSPASPAVAAAPVVADGSPPPPASPEASTTALAAAVAPTPSTAPTDPPPPLGARPVRGWIGPAAGVQVRPGVAPAPGLAVGAGVGFSGGWRLGASAGWEQPSALVSLGEGRTLTGAWLGLEGGWVGSTTLAPEASVVAGGAMRRYAEEGVLVGDVYTPVVGGSLGVRLVLAEILAARLDGLARCDLRPTDLYVPASSPHAAAPCGAGVGLGLEIAVGAPGARASQSTNLARRSGHEEGA